MAQNVHRLTAMPHRTFLALFVCIVAAAPLGADDGLAIWLERYAVRIVHGDPGPLTDIPRTGNAGIYLGRGLVLTAAHVAGNPDIPIGIAFENRVVPARFVRVGQFDDIDVSLLSVSPIDLPMSIGALPNLKLCQETPAAGQAVIVVEAGRSAESVVVLPNILPAGVSWRFGSLIRDVDTTGVERRAKVGHLRG